VRLVRRWCLYRASSESKSRSKQIKFRIVSGLKNPIIGEKIKMNHQGHEEQGGRIITTEISEATEYSESWVFLSVFSGCSVVQLIILSLMIRAAPSSPAAFSRNALVFQARLYHFKNNLPSP